MSMRIDHLLLRGNVDNELRVSFKYDFKTDEYPTIKQPRPEIVSINPSYAIVIFRSFEDSLYITAKRYFPFTILLEKSIKQISDHLFDLFPDINDQEFGIDSKMLNIFRTEKAMSTANITMIPCVWIKSDTNECYPGIEISGLNLNTFRMPLEDAMSISKLFSLFEPINFGLNILRIIGKVE